MVCKQRKGVRNVSDSPRKGKRVKKTDYFELLSESITKKILALAATGDLKDIDNIKKNISI